MKKLVLILLMLIVTLQSSIQTIIVACFELNREYISQNLCENRGTPEMNCKGKCYLQKSITKQEEQEKKQQSVFKNIKNIVLYCCSTGNFLFQAIRPMEMVKNTFYGIGFFECPVMEFFHPPQ